jgi:hypothetical protein
MNTRIFGLAVIALVVALLAGGSGRAWAATVSTCTSEYNTSNGGTSLADATNIGTVAPGCEIGPFSTSGGSNGNVATVNDTDNPSIYKFTWTGGNLTIGEELGNNGIGNNIDVELGLLSAVTLNTNGSLSGTGVVSTDIPFQSGPGAPVDIIDAMYLASGTYVLDTYLGTCGPGQTCSNSGSSTDPQYQVGFTPLAATPLPAALPLFVSGLGVMGMLLLGARKPKAPALAT